MDRGTPRGQPPPTTSHTHEAAASWPVQLLELECGSVFRLWDSASSGLHWGLVWLYRGPRCLWSSVGGASADILFPQQKARVRTAGG